MRVGRVTLSVFMIATVFMIPSSLAFADHNSVPFGEPADITLGPLNVNFIECNAVMGMPNMVHCTYAVWGTGNVPAASHIVFEIESCTDFINVDASMPQGGALIDLSDGTPDVINGNDVIAPDSP